MRKISFILVLVLLLLVAIMGCSNGENATTEQKPEVSLEYSILKGPWQPNDDPNGYGADILLKENLDDLTKQDIIDFIKALTHDKDPVVVRIYTSEVAYQQEQANNYGKEYKEGFLLIYIKNNTGKGAYQGVNEIRWMQEKGKFSNLFGEKTKF